MRPCLFSMRLAIVKTTSLPFPICGFLPCHVICPHMCSHRDAICHVATQQRGFYQNWVGTGMVFVKLQNCEANKPLFFTNYPSFLCFAITIENGLIQPLYKIFHIYCPPTFSSPDFSSSHSICHIAWFTYYLFVTIYARYFIKHFIFISACEFYNLLKI